MRALRAISTRATITPARFYNFYDWGGLRGDPVEMLRRHFDLFVHTGNGRPEWGMLRFPADRIDLHRWRPYVAARRDARPSASVASVVTTEGLAILSITPAAETLLRATSHEPRSGDVAWHEDEMDEPSVDDASWPVPLALVRAALLAGDLRPLHLLWLLSVQCGERRATTAEPPWSPRIERLTGSLYLFAEFLRLNPDLLAVALEAPASERRTAQQLLEAARARAAARRQAALARAAGARRKRLTALEKRQASAWSGIDRLLGAPKVKPSIYEEAVRRLTELQELAIDRGAEPAFRERLNGLLARHGRKAAFRRRVSEAGLTGSDW
jgi:hypothetical protein